MAVVQISKIQIRRGQKNTSSGLPQLASGELAWAIDTQELYIGNGAVSEGAPYVGNTKILTDQDNLLELVGTYQFAKNNPAIQTGPNANQPIVQNLQDVIDQFITASNFGAVGDGITDDTAAIQRALDNLYLNPAAYQTGVGASVDARTEILFGPGTFLITQTIYLPSYTFITGSGPEHTTFLYTGDGVAFKFVNGNSSAGEYTTDDITETNQPKYAILRDFGIYCSSSLASGLQLNAVTNSKFDNIVINGSYPYDSLNYTIDTTPAQTGLLLLGGLDQSQQQTVATTSKNIFNKVSISNFAVCLRAESNIAYNNFTNCDFYHAFYGAIFGYGGGIPVNNVISDSSFRYINREGTKVFYGYGNNFSNNRFEDVGNDGGHNNLNSYPIVRFNTATNQSVNNIFDRTGVLGISDFISTYEPEVDGVAYVINSQVQQTALSSVPSTPIEVIRLPVSSTGVYTITYKFVSNGDENQFRKGVMHVTVDIPNNNFEFIDEYEIISGGPQYTDENLVFTGSILDNTFVIKYKNSNDNGGILTFVTTALT